MKNTFEFIKQLEKSGIVKIQSIVDPLFFDLKLLLYNILELKNILRIGEEEKVFEFLYLKRLEDKEIFKITLYRLFEEFITRVLTFRNHESSKRKMFNEILSESLNKEYTVKKTIYLKEPIFTVISALRELIYHKKSASIRFSFGKNLEMMTCEAKISINTEAVLEAIRSNRKIDKDIRKHAIEFIDRHEGEIRVLEIVTQYERIAQEYYNWLFSFMKKLSKKNLKEFVSEYLK